MPWGRVDDTYYDHPKLEQLQGEGTHPDRLAAAGLNALAWSWCNRFLTDGHVPRGAVSRLGGSIELADLLVLAGLWEEAPGGYQIHDFLVYNDSRAQVLERRATEAKRKAAWRANKRPNGTDDGTSRSDDGPVPPRVPPSVPPGHGDGGEMSRRPSRGVSRPPAGAIARIPTRPDPTRPTESLSGEDSGARADITALLARGWPKVTRAQRKVLDEVLARHDVTGPEFAAAAIRATPPDKDPLEAVMAADRMWQEAQRRQADAEEQAAAADRASWIDRAAGG